MTSAITPYISQISSTLGIDQSIDILRPVLMRSTIKLAQLFSELPASQSASEAAQWVVDHGSIDPYNPMQPYMTTSHFCDALARFKAFTPASLQKVAVASPSTEEIVKASITLGLVAILVLGFAYILLDKFVLSRYKAGTFLVDVATYTDFRPEWTVSADEWSIRAQKWFNMDIDDINFSRKILERSGIGNRTHFPPGIAMFPPDLSIASARYEAEVVMFSCIDQLLMKNNVSAKDIDILVVNCSLFNPTPSLAAMVINNYKMREDIICYNLSGMGCSASPIAVNLASELLQTSKKSDPLAIVVSMENITQNIYMGRERAMMVANSLFRMGGAAVLLCRNSYAIGKRPAPRWRLNHLVRVHLGADTNAYTCVFQDVDKENKLGVRLDKHLMKVAAQALMRNMTRLGPKILPLHAKIDYAIRELYRRYQVRGNPELAKTLPPVVPNFKSAIDHIAIHAGGRAVVDAIQKALNLNEADVKASRDVLYKYGNTSSSSIWYEFVQIEEDRKPKIGEKIWQIAFGSGFKCNSAVWERIN